MDTSYGRQHMPQPTCRSGPVPGHIAVILDGNRRWAATTGCDLSTAYARGGAKTLQFLA
ncbi:hypothetical protein [Streptomyces yokosukanensis]|uniref:hypothetical protein n=1 Tax=Streptomyces yokosukanensis TaxID=67386 RepID=UPI00131EB56E|nr:hypothetical protein [Streptomyces yokosukanensis]